MKQEEEKEGRRAFTKRVRIMSYVLYAVIIVLLSVFVGMGLAVADSNQDLLQAILLFTMLAFLGIAIGTYTLTVSLDQSLT